MLLSLVSVILRERDRGALTQPDTVTHTAAQNKNTQTPNKGMIHKCAYHKCYVIVHNNKLIFYFDLIYETSPGKCGKKHFQASKSRNFPGGIPLTPFAA